MAIRGPNRHVHARATLTLASWRSHNHCYAPEMSVEGPRGPIWAPKGAKTPHASATIDGCLKGLLAALRRICALRTSRARSSNAVRADPGHGWPRRGKAPLGKSLRIGIGI